MESTSVSVDNRLPYVAPRTVTEKRLAKIWGKALNLEQVGIYDDFFEIGGSSQSMMTVLEEIQSEFDVQLSIRTIFDAPKILNCAERIEEILAIYK